MIDDVITLVKETITGIDQYGNEVKTPVEREVFCKVRSVTRNEFYSAAVSNLRPEYIFILSDYMDYEGETVVKYNGVLYSVIRTYRNTEDLNAIELTVERKYGDG